MYKIARYEISTGLLCSVMEVGCEIMKAERVKLREATHSSDGYLVCLLIEDPPLYAKDALLEEWSLRGRDDFMSLGMKLSGAAA